MSVLGYLEPYRVLSWGVVAVATKPLKTFLGFIGLNPRP